MDAVQYKKKKIKPVCSRILFVLTITS